jgi:hypothetical protein
MSRPNLKKLAASKHGSKSVSAGWLSATRKTLLVEPLVLQ